MVYHDADIQRGAGREFTLATLAATVGALSVTGSTVTPNLIHSIAVFDLDVTAAATAAGDTLDVYVDTSLDGGTSWRNIVHFTQLLGDGGVKRETMTINPGGNVGTAPLNTAADAASAGVRHLLGSQYRARYVQVDATTQNAGFAFTLKMRVI